MVCVVTIWKGPNDYVAWIRYMSKTLNYVYSAKKLYGFGPLKRSGMFYDKTKQKT